MQLHVERVHKAVWRRGVNCEVTVSSESCGRIL